IDLSCRSSEPKQVHEVLIGGAPRGCQPRCWFDVQRRTHSRSVEPVLDAKHQPSHGVEIRIVEVQAETERGTSPRFSTFVTLRRYERCCGSGEDRLRPT